MDVYGYNEENLPSVRNRGGIRTEAGLATDTELYGL